MRGYLVRVALAVSLVATSGVGPGQAAFFGLARGLKPMVEKLAFSGPALAPMAHTRFCAKYQQDCEVRRMAFRRAPVEMTEDRWAELVTVNRTVNRGIIPQHND